MIMTSGMSALRCPEETGAQLQRIRLHICCTFEVYELFFLTFFILAFFERELLIEKISGRFINNKK